MRPIWLQVEGFTSFRDLREIDFSDLDLFVITGPTGSGKTSILDAVTLALYGNVPRTNTRELRDLISLGVSQAKVQLDFEVDGRTYRVARRLPRDGAQSATIERVTGDEVVSEGDESGVRAVNDRIEEIVGLDYDAFTRAVLLPQGAFSEFLKGGARERREILIRLLDLERFVQAGKRANEKAKSLAAKIQANQAVLEAEYHDVSEKALEEARKAARQVASEAKALGSVLHAAQGKWDEREQLQRKIAELEELAGKLKQHSDGIGRIRDTWESLREREARTRADVKRLRTEKERAEAAHDDARNALRKLQNEIGDAALLERLAGAAKQLSDALSKIGEAEDTRTSRKEEHGQLEEHRKELSKKLEAAQKTKEEAKEAVEAAEKQLRNLEAQEERVQQREKLLAELAGARERESLLETELHTTKEDEATAEGRLQACREHRAAVEDENRAATIRQHLNLGDDCPVCGAEIKELLDPQANIEEQLETATSAEAEAEREYRDAAKEASRLEEALGNARSEVEKLDDELTQLEELPSPDDIKEELRQAKETEEQARESLDQAEKETRALSEATIKVKEDMVAVKAKLEEGGAHLKELRGAAEEARRTLTRALGDPLPEDHAGAIAERQQRLEQATSEFAKAEKTADEAREAYDEAVGQRSQLEDKLKSLDEQIQTQRGRLEDRRDDLERISETSVPTSPPRNKDDRNAELSSASEHCRKLKEVVDTAIKERIAKKQSLEEQLLESLSDVGSDPDRDNISSAVEELEENSQVAKLAAAKAKTAEKQLAEKLERKKTIEEGLAEKRQRKELYEKVGKELRKDNFIRFLLNESFHDLALRASAELKRLSAGRYSLAAEEDSFQVVDHANAEKRRSVVTLSGGETFLASLALALGLAQGITDIAGHSAAARLESMFIDEGFGTLDPTALDLAVDALERMREGERMVGVITHVPAVAERIPSGIAVEIQEGRSVVEMR